MPAVRDSALAPPIAWSSRRAWCIGRRWPELVWLRPIAPATAFWCPTCWGNGRIYAMARSGRGPDPPAAALGVRGHGPGAVGHPEKPGEAAR